MTPAQIYERTAVGIRSGIAGFRNGLQGALLGAFYPYVLEPGSLEPVKMHEIMTIERVSSGQDAARTLEGVVDLMEGRGHLFYARLKDGREALVKPYKSDNEKESLSILRGLGITFVVGLNDGYFVEERTTVPSLEKALESGALFFDEAASLFGMALYFMHSRGVSYNGEFNHHVFADPIAKKIKVSNFSGALPASDSSDLKEDMLRALTYLDALADSYKIKQGDFSKAIRVLRQAYLAYHGNGEPGNFDLSAIFEDTARIILHSGMQERLVKALDRDRLR